MRARIVDGPPQLAQAIAEWQAVRTEAMQRLTLAQQLEAAIKAALPALEEADAVRVGDKVVSIHRGEVWVESDTGDVAGRIYRRQQLAPLTEAKMIEYAEGR